MKPSSKHTIFIPFLDGILDFDCKACGSQCCSVGHLPLDDTERKYLLGMYPSLRYFYAGRKKHGIYTLVRCAHCFFLDSNGLCYIQKAYGYSRKPFACRMHPFYVAKCGGGYIVIPLYCNKLQVNGKANVHLHKQILRNSRDAIKVGYITDEIHWPARRLDLEKKILRNSRRFCDKSNYLDFAAYQVSMTTGNKDLFEVRSNLLRYVELWESYLQAEDINLEHRVVAFELTAITSILRTAHLKLRYLKEEDIPVVLLMLYFYMILYARIQRTGKYSLDTYNELLRTIPVFGLLYLKKEDLGIKFKTIDDRLEYLRKWDRIYAAQMMVSQNRAIKLP